MAYQVTARKYRPQKFSDVVGQEAIVTALKNALLKGKIPHALLFSGVRGVGKTTTARILAKALNCENPENDGEPCNICSQCKEITNGYSMNVIEIDGASNRGIDDIRELRENTIYSPLGGKFKVYIIDEVHMLTNEASNALLKTLEEPPPHVIFILATTEPQKVIPTIKSRCQHYVFKKLQNITIVEQLKKIASFENINYNEEALYLIAEASEGSIRDAESIFDQILLYTDGSITEKSVKEILGLPDDSYFEKLINSALKKDYISALKTIRDYYENYGELKPFLKNFIEYLKNGLIVKKIEFNFSFMNFSENKYNRLKEIFKPFSEDEIIKLIDLFTELFKEMKSEVGEIFLFEIALFKFIDYKNLVKISDIKDEIFSFLEKQTFKQSFPQRKKETLNQPIEVMNEPLKLLQMNEGNIKNALINYLSKNVLVKPMLQYITSVKFKDNNICIEFSKPHPLEYFTNYKAILEKKFSDFIGTEITFNFSLLSKNENERVNFSEEVREKATTKKKEEKIQSSVVETIKDLFNGKIE